MVKKIFQITVLSMILLLLAGTSPYCRVYAKENPKEANLFQAFEALSNAKVLVEYYYMEAGDYPESLEQLERDLNAILKKDMEPVVIPKDPATGKVFLYTVSSDRKTYTLGAPDPGKYGVKTLEMTRMAWGGLAKFAEERKNRSLQVLCYENIRGIATALEYYAKDHKGKFPTDLKELIPRYIRSMPACPVTGQFYEYSVEGDVYTISCPNPDKHGMEKFNFNSSKGWTTK